MFENERRELCLSGATSTWGVNTDVYRTIGYDGFRFFRIL